MELIINMERLPCHYYKFEKILRSLNCRWLVHKNFNNDKYYFLIFIKNTIDLITLEDI